MERLFHLSRSVNLHRLFAIIPETTSELEDRTVKRACFGQSVDGCLNALQAHPSVYAVYVPETPLESLRTAIPTVEQVPDAGLTGEVWVLDDVPVRLVGVVEVESVLSCVPVRIQVGELSETFHDRKFQWKWLWKRE